MSQVSIIAGAINSHRYCVLLSSVTLSLPSVQNNTIPPIVPRVEACNFSSEIGPLCGQLPAFSWRPSSPTHSQRDASDMSAALRKGFPLWLQLAAPVHALVARQVRQVLTGNVVRERTVATGKI